MKQQRFIETDDGVWHYGLQCCVESLEIDFARRCACLWMPARNCTDMQGVIALIESIDSRVSRIFTFSDGDRDTYYTKESGAWRAVRWRTKEPST
jgi:hypothetical protein